MYYIQNGKRVAIKREDYSLEEVEKWGGLTVAVILVVILAIIMIVFLYRGREYKNTPNTASAKMSFRRFRF
jgi:hypothetical protein